MNPGSDRVKLTELVDFIDTFEVNISLFSILLKLSNIDIQEDSSRLK